MIGKNGSRCEFFPERPADDAGIIAVDTVQQDGRFEMRYDPAIGQPFRQTMLLQDVNLWPLYDRIACPTLVVRGADSDLLSPETLAEMARRGPKPETVEIPGVGHAPMFMDAQQIALVCDFLDAGRTAFGDSARGGQQTPMQGACCRLFGVDLAKRAARHSRSERRRREPAR